MTPARCLVPLVAFMPAWACAADYSAKAIEAWVTDADTGQSLEGVNVVAHWELNYGLEGGGVWELAVMETVTDGNGRFAFPAWGPKPIPPGLPREARLKDRDPEILLFKAGYDLEYRTRREERRKLSDFSGHGPSAREWFANGERIALVKIESLSPQARARKSLTGRSEAQIQALLLSVFDDRLQVLASRPECGWRELPRAIASAEKARRALLARDEAAVREKFVAQRTLYERLVSRDAQMSVQCGASPRQLLEAAS